jgi:hypothetical protein
VNVERRFYNGFLFQGSWTWSKSLDVRSFDPVQTRFSTGGAQSASATPFDFRDPRLNYAPSDFDHTHVFQTNWVYELPFGKGKRWGNGWNQAVDEILGGWSIAGNAIYETGRPFTIYSGSLTFGNSSTIPASCSGKCDPYYGAVYRDSNTHNQFMFLGNPYSTTTLSRTLADGSTLFVPAPGQQSNIGRNYWRLPLYANANMTVAKRFRITEHHTLESRLEIQNLTNSEMYDAPGTTNGSIQATTFMRMLQSSDGVMASSPRRMQVSLKYSF